MIRQIFILFARGCAALGIALLINGIFIDGFGTTLGIGIILGFFGLRVAAMTCLYTRFSSIMIEFLSHFGITVLVLATSHRLFGGVLIVSLEALVFGGMIIGLAQLVATWVFGR